MMTLRKYIVILISLVALVTASTIALAIQSAAQINPDDKVERVTVRATSKPMVSSRGGL